MTKQKRYLITTADEKTWKFDQPVIFLGEWCRIYDRKHMWQNLDTIVAKPYGLDRSKKDTDFFKVSEFEQKLFPVFCQILNQHFNLSYSKRFWQIIIGHWFRYILQILLNRINTLKQCLQSHKICGTAVYKNNNYTLATLDHRSMYNACNDDIWNNCLNNRIMDFLQVDFSKDFLKHNNKLDNNLLFISQPSSNYQSFKMKIFKECLNKYNKISNLFINDNDAFIIHTYLPFLTELKLELTFRQWPQFWGFQDRSLDFFKKTNVPDKLLREKLTKILHSKLEKDSDSKSENDFEKIACSLLFELLPVCYLESFEKLQQIANQQPWPKSPKFIFTSNNYFADEIFKVWAASKVELGFKYYVGQHGNNYGTRKNFSPQIEELTSDKFITWGFQSKLPQQISAFVFKSPVIKKKNYNPKGGLILIEEHYPFRIYTWDAESEYSEYFNDQQQFVKLLNDEVKNKLTIRLHNEHQNLRWSEKNRWFDFDHSLKLDYGQINLRKLILKNRLIVHSYDSTGILETLSQNIPTLAFWQNGFDHLENEVIPYYQILVDAGIVHLSSKSAAKKVNNIWNDVGGWWSEDHLQNARKEFCERLAKTTHNPVPQMKKILTS